MEPVFRVLGPLRLTGPAGPIRLPAGRERVVAAQLILNANKVLSVERLADAVWDYDAPSTARTQIQICISRLRRAFDAAGLSGRIVTSRPGYQLVTEPDEVDLPVFEREVSEALRAIRRRATPDATAEGVARARRALGLFTGEPLADVGSEVVQSVARQLAQRRLHVLEVCLDAQLDLGQAADVVDEIAALVAEHPLHGRLVALNMKALQRLGRRADALAVYREALREYRDRLGLEPDPELRHLHETILQDMSYPAGEGRGPEEPRPLDSPSSSDTHGTLRPPTLGRELLPAPGTCHLDGRTEEFRALRRVLREARTGAPGAETTGTGGTGPVGTGMPGAPRAGVPGTSPGGLGGAGMSRAGTPGTSPAGSGGTGVSRTGVPGVGTSPAGAPGTTGMSPAGAPGTTAPGEGTSRAGTPGAAPTYANPTAPGPTSAPPAGPASAYPASAGPASAYPASAGPASAYPAPAGPASAYPNPAGPGPAFTASAYPIPAGPASAYPAPAGPASAYPNPAGPGPAFTASAYPAPAGPASAYPAPAGPGPAFAAPVHPDLSDLADLAEPGVRPGPVLVSVSGPRGIGKTAFVVAAAARLAADYPDGRLYHDMRRADGTPVDPHTVLATFLRALGVPSAEVPPTAEERSARYRELLRERRVLVVLDDAQDFRQVSPLLTDGTDSAVILVSREPWGAQPVARRIRLGHLDTDASVSYLARLVGAARIAAEPEAARRLAERCAGLPLALTALACRLNRRSQWPLSLHLKSLKDDATLLDQLSTAEPDVRAALQADYDDLRPTARVLLQRLARWGDRPFSPTVVDALLGCPPGAGMEVLDDLVVAGLVDVLPAPSAPESYRLVGLIHLLLHPSPPHRSPLDPLPPLPPLLKRPLPTRTTQPTGPLR
ncbi:winged helix-turn-helix domain-containing protein [Streptomyces roseirectus]|uniref:Winged helix-turn-helix domain-containing protein n=1 Tax=Streptomyces roseirectus TaxID=2768066 RepID=A0A7H0IE71_9ACTN|nr:AfsR/SARP family transcriptional regulator [Streptomyces roseirectus]QNP71087.1 winged helix-turn-helix domain-containing protein [Streptomyces roseirectus]